MQQPFGTWPSPVTAQIVAAQGLRLGAVSVDADDVYWVEGRPAEGGRNVVVRRSADGAVADMTPPGFNVRTRVHEYGGGAYVVDAGTIYFSNFDDQRLYASVPGRQAEPVPLTPPGGWFFADATVDRRRRRLICVREDHTRPGREPVNTLVAVPLDGGAGPGTVLVDGFDFFSTPRLDPDGSTLTWLCWNHPQMPWDGTELWTATVTAAGTLDRARRIAGGPSESIYQPGWAPDGTLYFVSDRDGWWRLYRAAGDVIEPVLADPPDGAEFGRPQWIFGTSTWACAEADRLIVVWTRQGHAFLGRIDLTGGSVRDPAAHPAGAPAAGEAGGRNVRAARLTPLAPGLEPHDWIAATSTHVFLVGASAAMPDSVVRVDLATGSVDTLRPASGLALDPSAVSIPEAVEFPTSDGDVGHAFYYPPRSGDHVPPAGERPPLIVITHGGPTTAARPTLDLRVQFWTTRGFAVLDVNYRGSTGFGRAYRERLKGRWGIVDVADVTHAARHMVNLGAADPVRLIIRGGSAGGYTTLAALTFHPDVFKAGASYYGVSDLEVLAQDTHKFESRYLDTLIGRYPEMRDEYRARSPIHSVDRLSCPLILFQGLEDRVVPPNQSAMMADAVRANGWAVAYLAFEGEQHGFRKAETIVRSLEAELFFYGAVFGFTPADRIEAVPIDNLSPG